MTVGKVLNEQQQGDQLPAVKRSEMDPPFTINDLQRAIPAHCFERSLVKSFQYVVIDVVGVVVLFYLASFIPSFSLPMQMIMWPAYWFVQGCTMTGLWVIAHECGHGGFSDSKTINDAVGLVLHSALLVPYFSWKYSHHGHHKATGHMQRDQVFVPPTLSRFMKEHSNWEDTPLMNLWKVLVVVLFGWPAYLLFNVLSQKYPGGKRANHFEPWSPLFKDSQRMDIVVSDVALLVVIAMLYMYTSVHGFASLMFYYGFPYLIVNFWLVTITYLQHTHVSLPHYHGADWTFLKGALATIDRDYGILNVWFHHIQDTHIVHHLFSAIPHYHAEEATKAVKPLLGKFYRYDSTPVLKALYQTRRHCKWVDDEGEVLYFRTDVKN